MSTLDESNLKAIERHGGARTEHNKHAYCQGAINELIGEVRRLRQGLWDIYAICGGDTDGDPTPAARVGDLLPSVLECARELRQDFENELAI